MKIYSVLYNDFAHLGIFGRTKIVSEPEELDELGIMILHGGADISPQLYNAKRNPLTSAGDISERDAIEVTMFKAAKERGITILGICRGAQLITALEGGKLVQHVENHVCNGHNITFNTGEVLSVSSCHHQMCNPEGTNHELLAWSTERRSPVYLGEPGEEVPMDVEPEVIWYPESKSLAIQGHPEWMRNSSPFVQHMLNLVEERLL